MILRNRPAIAARKKNLLFRAAFQVTAGDPVTGVIVERVDGINLLPILTGQQPPQERTFYWRVNRSLRQQKAIRHGDWKYVNDGGVDLLFNLQDDIGERRDLGYQNQSIVAALKARLKAWEEEMDRSQPAFVVR